MHFRPIERKKLLIFSLTFLFVALATTSFAATNEDFTISLDPKRVDDIEIGAIIPLDFYVDNISQIKGAFIQAKYDPALLAPVSGGFDPDVEVSVSLPVPTPTAQDRVFPLP